ncbi:MAG TPA: Asp-tRNA(Asn)/Glu-tRNA(Gln) amidotransferase subunit GatB [Chloroflexota bacterium]|nr:Asp-tRNA(Asn)/Glu-tRNA(Gln) amidotransferase subunit GatB [Chloroflexota bacterium]
MNTQVGAKYRTVIGLEVHAQLNTASKMFCGCSSDYANAAANSHVCPVCLGMPGVLPVMNRMAVDKTILTGLALGCEIPSFAKFDRKNYAYPDLMKWYQISQYDMPLCVGGSLDVEVDGMAREIGITRVHLEEDTAKMIHATGEAGDEVSLIDVNRSGTPLMEIVSEPDMTSPDEARAYLVALRNILLYLGVSEASMQNGQFRCDANISLWPEGTLMDDIKIEIKNMNSFRAVQRALAFEEVRLREYWDEHDDMPVQETRGWVEATGRTVSQRTKEYSHDYRYFPEPDLPPLTVDREWVERIRADMPQLPEQVRARLEDEVGLRRDDAAQFINDRELLLFFEQAAESYEDRQRLANRVLNDLVRELRGVDATVADSLVSPEGLVELLELEDAGKVNRKMGAEIFKQMVAGGRGAAEIAAETGEQISDEEELLEILRTAIADNPQAVADFNAGKQQAVDFLVGQVMKATRGRADPGVVGGFLRVELDAGD